MTAEIFITVGAAFYSPQISELTKTQAFSISPVDNPYFFWLVPVKLHFEAYARKFIFIQCYPIRLWQLFMLIYLIIDILLFSMYQPVIKVHNIYKFDQCLYFQWEQNQDPADDRILQHSTDFPLIWQWSHQQHPNYPINLDSCSSTMIQPTCIYPIYKRLWQLRTESSI